MRFEQRLAQVAISAHSQNHILTDGTLACTYQELPSQFARIDNYLMQHGVNPDSCLALECVNSVPGAITLLYLLNKGYRVVLLPPAGGKGKDFDFKPLLPSFCHYQIMIQSSSSHESVETALCPETFLLLEKNEEYVAGQDQAFKQQDLLFLRTSGSVGRSKIAVHSHSKLLGNALNCVKRFRLEPADRVSIPVPIFHMYGLGAGFLPSVLVGASIDLQNQSNLLKYLDRERQFNPNVAYLTPVLCDMFLQGRRASRAHKLVVTAGQRINDATFRAFDARFGPLVNLYGSTELGAIAACELDAPLEMRATTIGQPMPEVTIRIEENRTETAEAMPMGELYCQHAYGFDAYVDDDGKLISQAGDWFRTGDVAQQHRNGYLEILGRADHSVNRRGYLVLFSDIEKAMENLECIEQVVVVAAQDEGVQGQQIAAFCVPSQGAAYSDKQIRDLCFTALPNYAIPDRVFVVHALPTLPSGKVDRQALATRAGEH